MDINDVEYIDVVVSIPANAVKMEILVDFYGDGEINSARGEYDFDDIRECEETLEKYINGDLPKYVITEKGLDYLKYLEENNLI